MSGVDSIAIRMAAGYNVVKPAQWQEMDRAERFDLVKAKRVVFMCRGESVPVREALLWLAEAEGHLLS